METLIQPTKNSERINSMDVIRGVALLGILLMNITEFGLFNSYFDPTINGGGSPWDMKVWWMNAMFFEGTMRGMFSMLFGAGVLIFTSRTTQDPENTITDLYFRRLMWLFLFGIIHAYLLLWQGEILYPYALIGMFVYSFRKWKPKYLVVGGIVLLAASTALSFKSYYKTHDAHNSMLVAQEKKKNNETLTKEDSSAIEKWDDMIANAHPSKEKIAEGIAEHKTGYFQYLWHNATEVQHMQTLIMYRYFFWDIFAMMLFGMAFFKNGVLKGERSTKYYMIMMSIGYSIGLTVNFLESSYLIENNFDVLATSANQLTYDVGRVFTTLGHIGLIMLFIKSGILKFLQKSLAAVGQMAFTNYVMQTLICDTVFLGIGFGLYGSLHRYQLYYVVLGIWVFQLIVSPIWLTYFRFGPMEWIWRSLTYWKKQPFRA